MIIVERDGHRLFATGLTSQHQRDRQHSETTKYRYAHNSQFVQCVSPSTVALEKIPDSASESSFLRVLVKSQKSLGDQRILSWWLRSIDYNRFKQFWNIIWRMSNPVSTVSLQLLLSSITIRYTN